MCVNVLPASMGVYYMCSWCFQRSKEAIGFPAAVFTGGPEPPFGAGNQPQVLWK